MIIILAFLLLLLAFGFGLAIKSPLWPLGVLVAVLTAGAVLRRNR